MTFSLLRRQPDGAATLESTTQAESHSALAVPAFRNWLIASVISNIGSWMQIVAQGWLVLQLTNSPFYLGLVGLVRAIPTIAFSLIGGVLADRFDRRRILVVTQSVAGLSSCLLAVLTWTGIVTVWHILAIGFVSSVFFAVDNPTRQAIVPDLVGKERVTSAVGLNSAAWNGAAIVGPSVAGVLLTIMSAAGLFLINGLSYLAVIVVVITLPHLPQRPLGRRSAAGQLADGVRYIAASRVVWGLLALIAVPSVLARPYVQLMPIFARDILDRGSAGYGLLMAASGIGALVGALVTASLGAHRRRGPLLLIVAFALGAALIAFAESSSFALSMCLAAVLGGTSTLMMSLTNSLLQGIVPDDMRGRVLSVYTLIAGGLMPLGSMVLGSAGAAIGVPLAVTIGGVVTILTTLVIARGIDEVRRAA